MTDDKPTKLNTRFYVYAKGVMNRINNNLSDF